MLSRRLEMFLRVVETGSLSKAAASMYLAPVSVKQQIDALETMVGAKLFNRSKKGTVLTEAGRAFYAEARKMPEIAERAVRRAREAARPERLPIRLGTSLLRPCTPLIDLWDRMGGDSLSFDLQIIPFDDSGTHINDLVHGLGREIDCFVAPCDSLYWKQVCCIYQLDTLPLRLAMSRKHRLASKELLSWEDLDGETIMLPQSNDFTVIPALQLEIVERHPGIHVKKVGPHSDASVFNQCAQSDCLMASFSLWDSIHPLLVTKPVDWAYEMPYGIVYSSKPSRAMETFVSAVDSLLSSSEATRKAQVDAPDWPAEKPLGAQEQAQEAHARP